MANDKLTPEVHEGILYARRMGWSNPACAAHAGLRAHLLASYLRRGEGTRGGLNTKQIKRLPAKGSLERRCLDLFDAWGPALTWFERRNQAIVQRSAEGHWTPDHRWMDIVDSKGNTLTDPQGRPQRARVAVKPTYISPDPRMALELLERLIPERYRKAPATHVAVQVGVASGDGGVSFDYIDLSTATPEQIEAFTSGVDPEAVFAD